MNKKYIFGTVLTVSALIAASGSSMVNAQEIDTRPFFQQLSERFGLDEDEVEDFMEEKQQERHNYMMQNNKQRIEQAVDNGVLTQEQADALQDKHQQMWQERDQEREEHREEMDAWFEEQGIDHEAFMNYLGGYGPRQGRQNGMGFRMAQ